MSSTACRLVTEGDALRLLVGEDSSSVGVVTLRLYRSVSNLASVRQRVVGGELQAALLRPSMVGGPLCVMAASRSAILSQSRGTMKTRSMATEILYNLAPHTKISVALQQFGLQDGDSAVLAVTVDFVSSELIENFDEGVCPNASQLKESLQGETIPLEELAELKDKAAVAKLYKITKEELEIYDIERCCLSRMACKNL